jgi:hypothetical protein
MQIGEFPGVSSTMRRMIRAPINQLDKSTIVSILPKPINERKVTIQPGFFDIPAGSFNNPSILVVGSSSWWREVDESQPMLEIPVSSVQIADSIVKDYCNGLLACNMSDQMPGLFYIPGDFTAERLKKEHFPLLLDASMKQKKWFMELVRIADILWSRSNGNPLSISDDARLACREMNIVNKAWLANYQQAELTKCPACGNLRDTNFPICASCKTVVDKDKYKQLGLEMVK